MNLVEMWVTNITSHIIEDGLHFIIADFNCYGREQHQVAKILTELDWKMLTEKGYYLV